jgi:hypothetical protein
MSFCVLYYKYATLPHADWYHLNFIVYSEHCFMVLISINYNMSSFQIGIVLLVSSSTTAQVKAISCVEASLFGDDKLCD